MLAAFAVLALYTFGKAVNDIGRNDGSRIVTDPVSYTHLKILLDQRKYMNKFDAIQSLLGLTEK